MVSAKMRLRNSCVMVNNPRMNTQAQVIRALRRVPNVSSFARKHELAPRTLWNLLGDNPAPTKSTLKVVGAALKEEGLLQDPPAKKKRAVAA